MQAVAAAAGPLAGAALARAGRALAGARPPLDMDRRQAEHLVADYGRRFGAKLV